MVSSTIIFLTSKCHTLSAVNKSGSNETFTLSGWSPSTFWALLFENQNGSIGITKDLFSLTSASLGKRDFEGSFVDPKISTHRLCIIAQKVNFFIEDFFSKCEQIRSSGFKSKMNVFMTNCKVIGYDQIINP